MRDAARGHGNLEPVGCFVLVWRVQDGIGQGISDGVELPIYVTERHLIPMLLQAL